MTEGKTSPKVAVEELTFVLLYLTRMKEEYRGYRSWKGDDFDALDSLEEQELIFQGSNKARNKSVVIPEESVEAAKKLLRKYGIDDWERGRDGPPPAGILSLFSSGNR